MSPRPAPALFQTLSTVTRYLSQDCLGGPRPLKLSWVINLQKGGTLLYVGGLMWWLGHSSTAAWVYLALHGSYGLCWLLKELAFPDEGWQVKVTLIGALNAFLFVLGPYWVAPTLLITGWLGVDASSRPDWLLALCALTHTLGVALMLCADAQKHFTLKVKRGLITEGLFSKVRHPNYTGEVMIYGSYALLVGHWLPWLILAFVWTALFATNIAMKEASMSRHPGWDDYVKRTGYLLPKLW